MDDVLDEVIEKLVAGLKKDLPPAFLGPNLDRLTGGAICWRTIQNKRSRREIPEEEKIFIRSGTRLIVDRDEFLRWWVTTLKSSRLRPIPQPPPRRRRSPAARVAEADPRS